MKRLKRMQQQNKWMLVGVLVTLCLIAGVYRIDQAAAATEQDAGLMEYLDPFTLEVISVSSADTTNQDADLMMMGMSDITDNSVWDYAQPTKVWIPKRPVFRSPCVPSW